MRFIKTNVEWTESMKVAVKDELLDKLSDIVSCPIDRAEVKATIINHKAKVEISCNGARAQAVKKDFYEAAKDAVKKLKSIIIKANKKAKTSYKKDSDDILSGKTESLFEKEKMFMLDPITVDDAIANFEMTDYKFYIFRDMDDNNNIAVIYKRQDGKNGIIRCR